MNDNANNAETNNENENIELSLPINAAYVYAARQTASSVAGRLGFDADEVEDVKTAVSEACAYIIKKLSGASGVFKLCFILKHDHIEVRLTCNDNWSLAEDVNDDYSLMLIKALMERFDIKNSDGVFEMIMTKQHRESDFV